MCPTSTDYDFQHKLIASKSHLIPIHEFIGVLCVWFICCAVHLFVHVCLVRASDVILFVFSSLPFHSVCVCCLCCVMFIVVCDLWLNHPFYMIKFICSFWFLLIFHSTTNRSFKKAVLVYFWFSSWSKCKS